MSGHRRPSPLRRLVVIGLLAAIYVFIGFVAINTFALYTEVGDVTVLTMIALFAAWAWWYCEDRDRRRAAGERRSNLDGS